MHWFCCKKENSRQIFPQGIYSHYVKMDGSHNPKVLAQQILRYDSKRNPQQYNDWTHTKIKSKNIDDIVGYLEQQRTNFIDDDFPHSYLNISRDRLDEMHIEWKRVGDVIKNPVFIKSKRGVDLERLQNYKTNNHVFRNALIFIARSYCWKINQALQQKHSKRGIYQFKLFKKGVIQNVIIDDYIPTINGNFIFSGPCDHNQTYPMLLEKAIAKVCGGYSQIPINPLQIMEMINCGAVMKQEIEVLNDKESMKEIISHYLQVNGLALLITKDERKLRQYGINQTQIYQIINVHELDLKNSQEIVLEILSQSKMSAWNGRFNMIDSIWKEVKEEQKIKLFKKMNTNQSFCMPISEISKIFSSLVVFKNTDAYNKEWYEYFSEKNCLQASMFELSQPDHVFIRVLTHANIRQTFLVVRLNEDGSYSYQGGVFGQNDSFLDLQRQYEPGKYLICVYHEWQTKKSGGYTIYLSSGTKIHIQRYEEPLDRILQSICQQNQIEKNKQNSTIFSNYIPELGIAYLKVHHTQIESSQIPLRKIKIYHKQLQELDWQLLEPYSSMSEILVNYKPVYVILIASARCIQPGLRFPYDGLRVQGQQIL